MWKIFLVFIVLLINCSSQEEFKLSNQYGNFNRNNYYKNVNLISENYKEINLKKNEVGAILSPLPVDYNTFVIPGNNGNIFKVINDNVIWKQKLENDSKIASALCADNLGNIYLISLNGIVFSYDKNGNFRWKYNLRKKTDPTETYSDLLALNDGIIAGASNGKIIKLSFKGELIWSKNFQNYIVNTFAGKQNGSIVLPVTKNKFGENDSLLIINKIGKIIKSRDFDKLRIISTPVIQNQNIIIAGLRETSSGRVSEILYLDSNLNVSWSKKLSLVIKNISADENNIYIVGYNSIYGENMSGIYKFRSNGELNWQIYLETSVKSPVIIADNLLSVAGTSHIDDAIYYLRKDDGVVSHSMVIDDNTPLLLMNPAILKTGSMIFAATSELTVIKTQINEENL